MVTTPWGRKSWHVVEDWIKFIDILHYVQEATRHNNSGLGRELYPSNRKNGD